MLLSRLLTYQQQHLSLLGTAMLLSTTWDSRTRTRTWCPRTRKGQGVKLQGQGQGLDVQGRGLENWFSRILEDKDFPRGQQHCCEAVRWGRHELEPDQCTMANKPPIRPSLSHCKTMALDISYATLAYSILENFRWLELPRTRTRTCSSRTRTGQGLELQGRGQGQGLENWSLRILEDNDFPRGQHWACQSIGESTICQLTPCTTACSYSLCLWGLTRQAL